MRERREKSRRMARGTENRERKFFPTRWHLEAVSGDPDFGANEPELSAKFGDHAAQAKNRGRM